MFACNESLIGGKLECKIDCKISNMNETGCLCHAYGWFLHTCTHLTSFRICFVAAFSCCFKTCLSTRKPGSWSGERLASHLTKMLRRGTSCLCVHRNMNVITPPHPTPRVTDHERAVQCVCLQDSKKDDEVAVPDSMSQPRVPNWHSRAIRSSICSCAFIICCVRHVDWTAKQQYLWVWRRLRESMCPHKSDAVLGLQHKWGWFESPKNRHTWSFNMMDPCSTYVRTYVRTYVCMYVCVYIYVYIYICIYIYTSICHYVIICP